MARRWGRKQRPACNLCGGRSWGDMGVRVGVRCLRCNSLERTRLMWLYLQAMDLRRGMRVLHLAPETALSARLIERVGEQAYEAADLFPELYPHIRNCRRIDLCALEGEPSERYDLIVHSHVMEHVPCPIESPLRHLHRMLAPDGWHVCVIPFMEGRYDECFDDIGDDERTRRFGQADHVRRFGADDVDEHLGRVLRLPDRFDARDDFQEATMRSANIPEQCWAGWHTATVLRLRRGDVREG